MTTIIETPVAVNPFEFPGVPAADSNHFEPAATDSAEWASQFGADEDAPDYHRLLTISEFDFQQEALEAHWDELAFESEAQARLDMGLCL